MSTAHGAVLFNVVEENVPDAAQPVNVVLPLEGAQRAEAGIVGLELGLVGEPRADLGQLVGATPASPARLVNVDHDRLEATHVQQRRRIVRPPRRPLASAVGPERERLVALPQDLDVLDPLRPRASNASAKPSKLPEAGKGKRVESVKGVDAEEVHRLGHQQHGEHVVRLCSVLDAARSTASSPEPLGQVARAPPWGVTKGAPRFTMGVQS